MGNKTDPISVPLAKYTQVGKGNIGHKYMSTNSEEIIQVP